MTAESSCFNKAITRFDEVNCQDPNHEIFEEKSFPKELLYAKRMTRWLDRLSPEASEALGLAARCQHIARWEIPRTDFSMDRKGYLKWRTTLNRFHARRAAKILRDVGYDKKIVSSVEGFLLKKHLKNNPEMQLLEDIICLVFLESYFTDFSKKHDEQKMIPIIQKTWKKMTPRGHQAALALDLSPKALELIKKALENLPAALE